MIRPEAFDFHNGRSARSAHDLLKVLEEGPHDLFSDHVDGKGRNDFATWVELSLHEQHLARGLRAAKTRDETIALLRGWLEPHHTREHTSITQSKKDFFLGFIVGIIIAILAFGIVRLA